MKSACWPNPSCVVNFPNLHWAFFVLARREIQSCWCVFYTDFEQECYLTSSACFAQKILPDWHQFIDVHENPFKLVREPTDYQSIAAAGPSELQQGIFLGQLYFLQEFLFVDEASRQLALRALPLFTSVEHPNLACLTGFMLNRLKFYSFSLIIIQFVLLQYL